MRVLLQDSASLTCPGPGLHTCMCPDVHILTRTLTRPSVLTRACGLPILARLPGLCSPGTRAHSQLPPLPQVLPQSPSPEPVPCSAPWCLAWLCQGVGIERAWIKRDFPDSNCVQAIVCRCSPVATTFSQSVPRKRGVLPEAAGQRNTREVVQPGRAGFCSL